MEITSKSYLSIYKTLKVYDKSGRLAKVIADNKTTEYTYYDNGARKTIDYPDGSKEEYTYYKNNLLKTLINKKADGSIIDSYSYEYDKTNNRIMKTDSKGTTEYAYDNLNRLITVNENTTLAENRTTEYTYDKAGNRKTESITFKGGTTQTIYNYNKQNRLLNIIKTVNSEKVEERIYTFDKNGNQLKETIKFFENGIEKETKENKNTFDVLNRLIKTQTSEGNTVKNTYNGEGTRVSKEVDGNLRRYLYEYDKVVLELDEEGNTLGRNVYGLNLISREIDGQTVYYMYNGHADVTALINAEGEILSSYYYDAFGNILESTGNIDNPYRYAGYQYDEETDTYYCMARMYDPNIARFLSEDTYTGDINDPLSLNLYTYCVNNPLVYYDPNGHTPSNIWFDVEHGSTEEFYYTSQMAGTTDLNYVPLRVFEPEYDETPIESLVYGPIKGIVKSAYSAIRVDKLALNGGKIIVEDYSINPIKMQHNIIKRNMDVVKGVYGEFDERFINGDINQKLDYVGESIGCALFDFYGGAIASKLSITSEMSKYVKVLDDVPSFSNKLGKSKTLLTTKEIIKEASTNFGRKNVSLGSLGGALKNGIDVTLEAAKKVKGKGNLEWGFFDDFPQVKRVINGEERIYAQVGDRLYSRHALERMAPNTPEVRAILEKRAIKIAKEIGHKSQTKKFNDFVKKFVDPRNIPTTVIEDAIANTKRIAGDKAGTFVHETIDVKIIVNEFGDVITVIPK